MDPELVSYGMKLGPVSCGMELGPTSCIWGSGDVFWEGVLVTSDWNGV